MAKKRKKYLVTADSEALACSLVTNPAMEELFVAFNEDKPLIEKFADEKKHMITGVVAIPNKPIYRRGEDGEEYDIVFSEEAIEHMAKSYLKEYRQNEVTLQHQEDTEGVYLVEQWIKSDMVYDKSIALGLSRELPVGSWIQTYYVDSHDVWQRIESGELAGFSLECILGLEEFSKVEEINTNNNMEINETNEMDFFKKLKEAIKDVFTSTQMGATPEEELVAETNEQKAEMIETEMESEEVVTQVEPTVETTTVTDEHGTYEVTEKGDDIEIKPVETQPDPTAVEEPKVEEPKVEDNTKHLEDLINSLKEEINALKEHNDTLSNRVKEMSKEPSAKPISTVGRNGGGDTYSAWREQMRNMIG